MSPKSPMMSPKSSKSPIPTKSPIVHKSNPSDDPSFQDDTQTYIENLTNYLGKILSNENDIRKYLCVDKIAGTGPIRIQVHINKKSGKRLYDKHHVCYFCGTWTIKMERHLLRIHPNEPEVKRIEQMTDRSKKKKDAWELLRLKGDFFHNWTNLWPANVWSYTH